VFTCDNILPALCLQVDRLQAVLQERESMSGQTETVFKSRLTDKEEEGARLKAEVNILHEKLSQTQAQVGGVVVVEYYYIWSKLTGLHSVIDFVL